MVTLKQLAEQLNVSISTVSKALNDSDEISKDTIIRVKELAKHYNYRPNRVAVNLKNSSTQTIGVIIPNILNRFFAKTLFGIEKEASELGYNIITCISNESYKKEKDAIELLANGSVDGFLLAISEETQLKNNFDHIKQLQNADTPFVLFDRVSDKIDCDKVVIDDFKAIKKATQLLLDEGRKNIAFISNIEDLNVGKSRKEAYKSTIFKQFNTVNESLILAISDKEESQDKIKSLLKANPDIDGIISADNVSGTIAVNVATSLKYKIPEDISIIGFSDSAISNLSVPKLSYIYQNAEQIGRSSINLLVERMNDKLGENKFVKKVVPVSIINQESF